MSIASGTVPKALGKGRASPLWTLIVVPLLLVTVSSTRREEAVFYPTYGYIEGASWVIPIRVKVQEPRELAARTIGKLLGRMGIGDSRERENYRTRIADFVADDESGEQVWIRFDADPQYEVYGITNATGGSSKTDSNGVVEGAVRIDAGKAQPLLDEPGATDGWLTFDAASKNHTGRGRVRLIGPTGLSVISDIDDTVKVSEVPAGKRILALNTFCRDFAAVPELMSRYAGFKDAAFHYVSGGPWQLYRPLAAFLIDQSRFPEGSFHMRVVGGNLVSASRSLEDLGSS